MNFAFFRDLKQHIRNLLGIHFIKCYTLEIQEMWRKQSRGMNFKKNHLTGKIHISHTQHTHQSADSQPVNNPAMKLGRIKKQKNKIIQTGGGCNAKSS